MSSTGNHVEKTVRTTRRTTAVIKTSESASSSTDEVNTLKEIYAKPNVRKRTLRSNIFKTSDYSSEDGDSEVTSSKTVKQNEVNQIKEDARILANGSEMPALELYRKSGRYWDVYPKTDWTYSHHSKDRVEIAPGVVAMPNMSRKTIHSLEDTTSTTLDWTENSQKSYLHKNTNTDSYLSGLTQAKTNLFSNSEEYYIKRRTLSRWNVFTRVFTTIFQAIITVVHLTFKVQTAFFSYIHRIASQIMLWDTYLLWKTHSGQKINKLSILCLLPLLLLSGIWFFSDMGSTLYGAISNYSSSTSPLISTMNFWSSSEDPSKRFQRQVDSSPTVEERIVRITEKIVLEPPSASEIARSFSVEQLEAIAGAVKGFLDLDEQRRDKTEQELVEKIVNNPNFINIINNYYKANGKNSNDNESKEEVVNKQQVLINALLKQIEKLKEEMLLNNKLQRAEFTKLSLNMRKCCDKRPVINIEAYVSQALTELLNNPEFLNNQRGLNSWLRSLFFAKEHLEERLSNLTAHLDTKFTSLLESNSQVVMNKVTSQLINNKETVIGTTNTDLNEEFVKKIVKKSLAIYDADRTGLVDYAMESMGGQVVTTRCTEPYNHGKAVVSVFGIPLWHVTYTPRTIITPTLGPGDCWAFQNFPGFVVIKLSNKIRVDAFSMEHVSRLLLPDGKMDSAPKEFEVYGLKEENDMEPILLGNYKYEYDGESLQFFPVEKDNQVFDMIEIRIISNHGNPNYTCLYRFRVHGKLYRENGR
ncbi:hypothetical protein ABEB36_009017 [Hypothenemus hampei]